MEGPAFWAGLSGSSNLIRRGCWVEEFMGKPRRYGEVVPWYGIASRFYWWKDECVEFVCVGSCSGSSGSHDVGRVLGPRRTP